MTAPDLFTCEVASGLLKYMVRGDITTVITMDSRFAATLREMRIEVFCSAIDSPSS